MGYPACFESQNQFDGWKLSARLAREMASICTDCTKEYQAKMLDERRCNTEKWSKIAFYSRQENTLEQALTFIDPCLPRKPKKSRATGKNLKPRQDQL